MAGAVADDLADGEDLTLGESVRFLNFSFN